MAKKKTKSKNKKRSRKELKMIQEAKNASIATRKAKLKAVEVVSKNVSQVKSRLKNILSMDRAL